MKKHSSLFILKVFLAAFRHFESYKKLKDAMTITQKVLSAITILISLMACQSELLPDAPDLPDTPFAVTSVEFTADDYQIAQANNAFALRL